MMVLSESYSFQFSISMFNQQNFIATIIVLIKKAVDINKIATSLKTMFEAHIQN